MVSYEWQNKVIEECHSDILIAKSQNIYHVTINFLWKTDSFYLEVQGTLCKTSRYPYLDISYYINFVLLPCQLKGESVEYITFVLLPCQLKGEDVVYVTVVLLRCQLKGGNVIYINNAMLPSQIKGECNVYKFCSVTMPT